MAVQTFQDLLSLAGDKGRWQYVILLFTWIDGCITGFHHLSSVFLGYSPAHWCSPSPNLSLPASWTPDQIKNFTIPLTETGQYESCKMYDIQGTFPEDFSSAMLARGEETVECVSWSYDLEYGRTIVVDWDLVCERLPLLSTVQSSYMGGVFVGCIFWGWASDKYGRRLSILVSAFIQLISSIVATFSPNYIMFLVLRFLVAFSVSGVFECGFVLVTEIVSPDVRTPFGILTQFPFGVGATLLPLVAYFVRDWSDLQLAISVPSLLLISYYWFIPESPRWLISVNRLPEALEVLKAAAKMNGKSLPNDEEMLEAMRDIQAQPAEFISEKSKKEKVLDVFKEVASLVKTPEMRRRTMNVYFSWLVVTMVYYGLAFNTKNIGVNIYLSVFVSGFVDVIACVLIIPALARFGRVWCYSLTFLLGGVASASVAVILWTAGQGTLIWLTISLAMLGKFLIAAAFDIAYLYTAELFPTPVRNVAVGGASTFARIGSMSAPYIVDILGNKSAGIPAIIFGLSSIMAGLLAMLLPETLNRQLPETIEDVENYATLKARKKREKKGMQEMEQQ